MPVKDARPVHHARIYHCAIEDPRFSAATLVVLNKIARFADFNEGDAWPGMRVLAKMGVKQHLETVCNNVKKLEKLQYLIIRRRAGSHGQNYYILTNPSTASLDGRRGVRMSRTHRVRPSRT